MSGPSPPGLQSSRVLWPAWSDTEPGCSWSFEAWVWTSLIQTLTSCDIIKQGL